MRKKTIGLCVACFGLAGPAQAGDSIQELHTLFRRSYEWELREFPEMAMARGDYSNADRVTDSSLQAIQRRHEKTKAFLEQLRALPTHNLNKEDLLNYQLFELKLTNAIQGHRFRMFLAPIGGRFGVHQRIPQMAERVRFRSRADYANYLTRLEQVPTVVQQTIERLALGLEERRTPPRVTLAGLAGQFHAIADDGLKPLAEPFQRMPDHIDERVQQELRRRFRNKSLPAVENAIDKLSTFVVKRYIPRCRRSIAAIDLPDGAAYYAYQLRVMTTTDMTPREVHDLGLSEVARIKAEMMQVIRSSDFMETHPERPDDELFGAFVQFLRSDPRFYHESDQALLAGYRDICKRVDPWLAKLFSRLPRLPYGVREIPAFMAPNQTTAYYSRGDIRNAEPGYFYANTHALNQRPTYEMIPLALHEAVPGHHLQIALAQELQGLPEFRKDSYFTAFGEGWALYAERLGLEMGLYEDPYDNFGRLLYEMWRACRLVVDTGMHAFGWTRARAIGFMLSNTALSELNIETEIDRYISWPGQACAYKIGELKIRQLRETAQETLGEVFDLRAFHDEVLGAGALPLTFLEHRIDRWIDSKRFKAYD